MLKALDIWLPAYLRRPPRIGSSGLTHVLVAICDHFEPFHATDRAGALRRVSEWRTRYPQFSGFRDSDYCAPKQTFFYPIEQYDREVLAQIAALCRETGCEVEVHLHHSHDTAENLRRTLERGKEDLAEHRLLSCDETGAIRFGFIHGNWALDNSGPGGRACGVRNELRVLKEAGCYADFTLPSAPSRTQTRIINSLYYATNRGRKKSHNQGRPAAVGTPPSGDLLLVQGPLALNWQRRKLGFLPRIENADLTGANPPTLARLKLWLDLQIHVKGRPEWLFVKLHTHGAPDRNRNMLLGEPMRRFHAEMLQFFAERPAEYALHYVSAREMVNILHAAEDGREGSPGAYRNYKYRSRLHL